TSLEQFTLSGNQVRLTAQGEVPGQVINQYALDESGGYLRIATTTNDGPHTANNVYVLSDQGGALTETGKVEGLAPDERHFAGRLLGDRAFVETFRQVDPVFALDLSDPAAPKVAGELHMPGFSHFLQPTDATHLVGIGQDTDASGRPQGLAVSLFDVSDL